MIEVKDFLTAEEVIRTAWAGAKDRLEAMTVSQVEQVLNILEDANAGEPMTRTELNDFFWFEEDTIADWLGFESFEALEEYNA